MLKQGASGKTCTYVLQADRELKGPEFAAAYAASLLCAENARCVDQASIPVLHANQEPLHDISSPESTTVNMFWAMTSIVKVCLCLPDV